MEHTWYVWKRFFASPVVSSSALHPQELNPWNSSIEEPLHSSTVEKSERRTQDQDQRYQSGQSAKNSESSVRIMEQTNNDCRYSDLHFDKYTMPATFLWKKRCLTELRTCSQFLTEVTHWIKEVEMVDPVDDLLYSSSIRGSHMTNFVLDARIASALNRIIHTSHFERRISLEEQKPQKENRFFRGRKIAYLIYEQFWVTGTDSSVETYTDLFTIAVLRNDEYSGIRFKVGRNVLLNDKESTRRHLGRIVQTEKTSRRSPRP